MIQIKFGSELIFSAQMSLRGICQDELLILQPMAFKDCFVRLAYGHMDQACSFFLKPQA